MTLIATDSTRAGTRIRNGLSVDRGHRGAKGRRRLSLHAFLLIALVAAFVGFRGAAAGSSRDASAPCSGCFAAPVSSPDLGAGTVAADALEDYGRVVLYQPETWDAVSLRNVEDALAMLPANVRTQLGNPDLGPVFVSVNNTGSLISGKRPYGRAANMFSTTDSTSQVVLYPQQPVKVILHELGHAYNLRGTPAGSYGLAYLSPELQDFMTAVGWRVLTPAKDLPGIRDQASIAVALDGTSPWTNLSRNDPLEDFANSFALYFSGPEELQRISPARYQWFSGHFAN